MNHSISASLLLVRAQALACVLRACVRCAHAQIFSRGHIFPAHGHLKNIAGMNLCGGKGGGLRGGARVGVLGHGWWGADGLSWVRGCRGFVTGVGRSSIPGFSRAELGSGGQGNESGDGWVGGDGGRRDGDEEGGEDEEDEEELEYVERPLIKIVPAVSNLFVSIMQVRAPGTGGKNT